MSLDSKGTATLSLSTLGAGVRTITAIYGGQGTTFGSSNGSTTIVVKEGQTITFGPLSGVTLGAAPITLNASASSGLAVTFSVISGPGTVKGSTLTVIGAGTITIEADQAGNADYQAARGRPGDARRREGHADAERSPMRAAPTIGSPLPATATVAGVVPGVDKTPGPTLDGVAPSLTYFSGTYTTIAQLAGVTPLSGAPSAIGSYTVEAYFPGSVNYTSQTTLADFAIVAPLTIAAVTPVSPNPRNTPVSTISVSFSEPINPANFDDQALSLTDNGGPNLITGAVTVTLVSGTTYQIGGLSGLTTAKGHYTLTVNAADIQDQNGNPGTGSLSTSWLMDTTPPTSTVSPLPKRGTSLSFPVSVTGTDPTGPMAARLGRRVVRHLRLDQRRSLDALDDRARPPTPRPPSPARATRPTPSTASPTTSPATPRTRSR